jgi:membrane-associated protease RseP (regulator of RpoE activity)
MPAVVGEGPVLELIRENWRDGLIFMSCVMAVLLFHEMGHFVMTLRYRVPASFPFFIPVPFMITGTMGAVIAMDPYKANRKEVFDIGLAGPLAGLLLTIPMTVYGIIHATYDFPVPNVPYVEYGDPLLVTLLIPLLRDLPEGAVLEVNAVYMAGWVGMLVTGLNMLPVSQLDGGHVLHGVFGRYSRMLARAFLISAIAFIVMFDAYHWILMLVLVIIIGPDHPPTADDTIRIGPLRWLLGLASLAIPVFCFPPFPLQYGG